MYELFLLFLSVIILSQRGDFFSMCRSSVCSLRPTYFTLVGLVLGLIPLTTLYLTYGHLAHPKTSPDSPEYLRWWSSPLQQAEQHVSRSKLRPKGPRRDHKEVAMRTNSRRLFYRTRSSDKEGDEKRASKVEERAPRVEKFSDVLSLGGKPDECEGDLCLNFLSDSEKHDFRRCLGNATRRQRRRRASARGTPLPDSGRHFGTLHNVTARGSSNISCRFRDGRDHGAVGLVSFPGSGNTWVRHLLQLATGICTGSQYCDTSLRLGGFDGEGMQSSSVLVVKSHSPRRTWTMELNQLERGGVKNRVKFDSAIFLIRNPYDALVAEWNRVLSTKYSLGSSLGSQHVDTGYGKEYFQYNPKWVKFARSHIARWRKGFEWVLSTPPGHKLLVVTFEELKENRISVVDRMLDFLHYKITNDELKKRLSYGADKFKRPKSKQFEHFTPELKALINLVIHTIADFLDSKLNQTFDVENYVRTN